MSQPQCGRDLEKKDLSAQGFDYGTQYRSAIFYHIPQQEEIARKSKEELKKSGWFKYKRIVTEIVPASTF
jgi:peptide-methionine (S)-S-oxide reductase